MPMPTAHETQDRASGIFLRSGGTGWGGASALSRGVRSLFVLSARLRLRVRHQASSVRLRVWLDAQLRSCFIAAAAGSSDSRSETGRSVAASPAPAVQADSRAGA